MPMDQGCFALCVFGEVRCGGLDHTGQSDGLRVQSPFRPRTAEEIRPFRATGGVVGDEPSSAARQVSAALLPKTRK